MENEDVNSSNSSFKDEIYRMRNERKLSNLRNALWQAVEVAKRAQEIENRIEMEKFETTKDEIINPEEEINENQKEDE